MRAATLAGGLAGAVGVSQFPEYSQQYVQRLGGAVDALSEVVADFDASAAAEGLTRDAALAQLSGEGFADRHRRDMERTFQRYYRLRADLTELEGLGPFSRAYNLPRFTDAKVARAAWGAFSPAVPVNFAGLSFAGLGFVLGLIVFGALFRLIALPFRRSSRAA